MLFSVFAIGAAYIGSSGLFPKSCGLGINIGQSQQKVWGMDIENLKARAIEIKNEKKGTNTAERTGGLLYNIIEEIEELENYQDEIKKNKFMNEMEVKVKVPMGFIDMEKLGEGSYERNYVNIAHIIRVEKVEKSERSKIRVHLVDGSILHPHRSYKTIKEDIDTALQAD